VKSYKVSACCGVFTKQCNFNTKIDSPPSVYGKSSQKFLQQLAVELFLKVWEPIFENNYYGFKRIHYTDILKSSMSCLIKHFKKTTSILLLPISTR